MKDITIILPLFEYNTQNSVLFKKAITSVIENNIISKTISMILIGEKIVVQAYKEDLEVIDDRNIIQVSCIENETSNNIQSQINKAVENCQTEYFSILEFDDTYQNRWFEVWDYYMTNDESLSDISVCLPLVINSDEEGVKYGFTNEAVWAISFSNEIGYLEKSSLELYPNFMVSGGIIKKDDFIEAGGLKTNFNIAFWYEFLLRLLNKGKLVYVIPKVGYEHIVNREKSFTELVESNVTSEEISWWFTKAKEVCVNSDDNVINYKA